MIADADFRIARGGWARLTFCVANIALMAVSGATASHGLGSKSIVLDEGYSLTYARLGAGRPLADSQPRRPEHESVLRTA